MAVCFSVAFVLIFGFSINSVIMEQQEHRWITTTTIGPDLFLAPSPLLECTSGILNVKPQESPIRITDVSPGVVDVQILVDPADRALVWFDQDSNITSQAQWDAGSEHNGCAAGLSQTQRIEKLLPTTLYTFCLMTLPEMTVSMFDCTSYLVPPQHTDLVWLTTSDRPIFIACVIVYLLAILTVSAGLTFWVIQRRPELLGGHHRMVFVENQAKNILIMPPDYVANKKLTNIERQQKFDNDKSNFLKYYCQENGGKPRINSFNISPDNKHCQHGGKDYQDYDNANYIITGDRSSGGDKMPYMRKGSSTASHLSDKQRPLPAIPAACLHE